jgi:peptidoglycan/xylan/chitin deacetylase (PgdA/CDA1 family)
MINEGHQVASHTWSHQDLSAITKEQRYDQMVRLEMALTNIIGKFPTYVHFRWIANPANNSAQLYAPTILLLL